MTRGMTRWYTGYNRPPGLWAAARPLLVPNQPGGRFRCVGECSRFHFSFSPPTIRGFAPSVGTAWPSHSPFRLQSVRQCSIHRRRMIPAAQQGRAPSTSPYPSSTFHRGPTRHGTFERRRASSAAPRGVRVQATFRPSVCNPSTVSNRELLLPIPHTLARPGTSALSLSFHRRRQKLTGRPPACRKVAELADHGSSCPETCGTLPASLSSPRRHP